MGRPVRAISRRDGGVHAGDLAGLALDLAGEHQRPVTQRAGASRRPRPGPGGCCPRWCCARAQRPDRPAWAFRGSRRARPVRVRSLTDAGTRSRMPYRSRISTAPAKVEASGAVGPEPMTSRSSPITSESISDSTRAGAARRASCPPLMREMCLRMALISWILAPEASSSRVVACFSSRVMPSAGSGISADAPPEMRQITRSSFPAPAAMRAMRSAPATPLRVGHRMAALVQLDAAQLGRVPVLHVDAGRRRCGGRARARRPAPWTPRPCPRRRRRCCESARNRGASDGARRRRRGPRPTTRPGKWCVHVCAEFDCS